MRRASAVRYAAILPYLAMQWSKSATIAGVLICKRIFEIAYSAHFKQCCAARAQPLSILGYS
jgi:hypothetical protein